ncbi:MAG TPA: FCD domain-containing protein [Acidimicrobiia bacterium]|nr:FCD domain-containing protein [Acidimicrobiia bacterium]
MSDAALPAMSRTVVAMPTAAQLVADAIRRSIVTGELADGASLPPEPVLIECYGVSRPTLREALRILQSESLITIRRGSRGGARVNAPRVDTVARQAGFLLQHQQTSLADVYEARLVVEPPAAGLLAERRTAAVVRELRAALVEEQAAADPVAFAHASARFHERVVDLAGNHTLALFTGILAEIIDTHTETVMVAAHDPTTRARDSHAAHRSHERLAELVAAGDADGARAHWQAHMEAIGRVILKATGSGRVVDLFR